nr:MAG: major capsid protein [Microvirus sp.]
MMKMYRANFYNEGSYYSLVPVFRKAVVPGESIEGIVSVRFEAEPLSMNCLTGGLASVMAFYVPYRLLASGFVDFIADPQVAVSALNLPTSSTPWPLMFESIGLAGGVVSTFGRRAFKLGYNQFFGSDDQTESWYSDITLDTDVSEKRVRTSDQLNGVAIPGAEAPAATLVSYGGAGTYTSLTVEQMVNAMSRFRSDRAADMTGDKYVDALRRFGVSLDWRVQNAPEFLGRWDAEFDPRRTRQTGGDAGVGQARFEADIPCKLGRKFFAEHGVVLFVLAVRPFDYNSTPRPAPDACMLNVSRDTIFQPDQQLESRLVEDNFLGVGTAAPSTTYRLPRWAPYLKGANMIGRASSTAGKLAWAYLQNKNVVDVVYPSGVSTVTPIDKLENDFAVSSRSALSVYSRAKLQA